MVGLAALAMGGFGYGHYESNKYDAYKLEVVTLAQKQIDKNEAQAKEQALINKGISNEYEAKLSAIRSYYGGLHNPRSSSMSSFSNPSIGSNVSPADQLLACAATTQQLVSLQEWVKEQSGL
jgi:hypothetical protein